MPNKKNTTIKKISAREILDSRGNPTLETKVELSNSVSATASVPSGASTGTHESLELRDNDKKRYNGKGVLKAIKKVNKINKKLIGESIENIQKLDELIISLDPSPDKSQLGANSTLSVSWALAKASALNNKTPVYELLKKTYGLKHKTTLPTPMFNIFNGGKHADTNLDIQEIMIVPVFNSSFAEKLRAGAEIFHALAKVLHKNYLDTDIGNEGGYAPNISSTHQAFDLILEAIEMAGYKPGQEIGLALDVGASEIYDKDKRLYLFKLDNHFMLNLQLIRLYRDWMEKYPIFSIEDPLAEDDWQGWQDMMKEFKKFKPLVKGQKPLIVGDDLLTTNVKRLELSLKKNAANAAIVKPNQIGTLLETFRFAKQANKNKYKLITSHRSGETTDDIIADIAISLNSEFVKFGSLSRGERICKYNRLLEIEENLK